MKVFTTLCKDDKTGFQMILSECSYNMAMDWLDKKLKKTNMWIEQTRVRDGLTEILITDKHLLRGRTFYYDEERGYLLGE